MPNVNDIANLAEALEKHPIIVIGDRCVAVRNRNATCRRCVQTCAFEALKVESNEIFLDAANCVGCGACIGACPTEAFVAIDVSDRTITETARDTLDATNGTVVIACARISSKRLANPETYVEVPCLSRIDESLLLEIVSYGVTSIVLVDGNCKTCKYRDCTFALDQSLAETQSILEASGGDCALERSSSFPEELRVEDTTGMFGSTRRGFFSDAVGAARETALAAAKATIEQELGMKVEQLPIGERFRVASNGSLPTIETPRHNRLLDAFDALGEPAGEKLDSRRFATVTVNVDRCNSCGMCAVFCPTGALRRNPCEKLSDPIEYIEFSAAECVNCNLCKDVCWKGALTIEQGVTIEQLYDFEPQVFELSRAQKKKSFFGKF